MFEIDEEKVTWPFLIICYGSLFLSILSFFVPDSIFPYIFVLGLIGGIYTGIELPKLIKR